MIEPIPPMALTQSVMFELLEAFGAGDGVDLIREAVLTWAADLEGRTWRAIVLGVDQVAKSVPAADSHQACGLRIERLKRPKSCVSTGAATASAVTVASGSAMPPESRKA